MLPQSHYIEILLLGHTAVQLDLSCQEEPPGLHLPLARIGSMSASITQDATPLSCVCGSRPT